MTSGAFAYSNLPVRPGGRAVSVLSRVLPGVRQVQQQVVPWARAWEAANRAAWRREGPLWIVLGDSMAQGIGASAPDRGWAGQLADRLDPALVQVNLSAYGARTRDAVERQWPAAQALARARGAAPALVTVVIGSNDVVSRQRRGDLPVAFARLLEVLPAGAVVSNLPNPHRAAREVDALLRTAVSERGLRLADTRGPQLRPWRGRLAPDHFHPNDAGYAGLADVVAGGVPAHWRRGPAPQR